MVLARFERDFIDDAGNVLTSNVTVEVRRMSGGLPQLYSDRDGSVALGNPFVNDGGAVAFHAEGNAYRVTVTQGAFTRELTYVALGLAAETDFTFAQNQGVYSAVVTYGRGDYVVHNGVGIFISTQDGNLNHTPDSSTPGSTAYWTYYPGLQGPAGPAGSGMDWQGAWVNATSYQVADGVAHNGSSYICLVAHTSGTFATDLAGGKWELFAAKGDTGATGASGANGTNGTDGVDGADGTDPGVLLTWDDINADADPGAGNIRADDDALASATMLYVSKTNRAGDDISSFLAALDDSTNPIKGHVVLTRSSGNVQAGFNVTGITDASGYVKVVISGHWGATGFLDGHAVSFQFSRAGNKGADGAGSGDVVGPGSAVNNSLVAFDGTTGELIKDSGLSLDTDGTLTANSDAKLPSQKAVKTYVDQIIAAQDAMVFKGVIDCSANPNYPAADRGHTYRVSVAGKIGGASGVNVEVADLLMCLTDGTSSGNQATVGTAWSIAQANLDGAVIGPSSVTDGSPVLFDGTTGKLIKQSTFAAFKTALALVKGDVGLGNVDNTSDSTKNSAAATLTNKRVTPRVTSITSSATPTVNTDNTDVVDVTAQAAAITSMSTNLSGTPTIGDVLIYQIKDNGTARAITWGASFTAKGVALPTTTVISKLLTVGFIWNGSNWGCVGSAQEA